MKSESIATYETTKVETSKVEKTKEKVSDRLSQALVASWVFMGGQVGFSLGRRGTVTGTGEFSNELQTLVLFGTLACVAILIAWMTHVTRTYNPEISNRESFTYVMTSAGGISVILLGMVVFFHP